GKSWNQLVKWGCCSAKAVCMAALSALPRPCASRERTRILCCKYSMRPFRRSERYLAENSDMMQIEESGPCVHLNTTGTPRKKRVKSEKRLLRLACAGLLLTSCTTSKIVVGHAREPIPVESVKLYLHPPKKYEEIALLD